VDGVASFMHRDHLANVRAITDASGALVERTAYSPYNAEDNEAGLTNPTPEEHGFIGERHDASTGHLRLGNAPVEPFLIRPQPQRPLLRPRPRPVHSARLVGGHTGGRCYGLERRQYQGNEVDCAVEAVLCNEAAVLLAAAF